MQHHNNAEATDNINIIDRDKREVTIIRDIEVKKGASRYSIYCLFLYSFVFEIETRSKQQTYVIVCNATECNYLNIKILRRVTVSISYSLHC